MFDMNKGKYLNELATLETMVETYLDADEDLSICLNAINDLCGLVLKYNKLEKALDKACEELETHVFTKVYDYDEHGEYDYAIPKKTKEEWKEWCLNGK